MYKDKKAKVARLEEIALELMTSIETARPNDKLYCVKENMLTIVLKALGNIKDLDE